MAKHRVAKVDEIPPGGRKVVEISGRSIGVFNIDGEFFALRNRCPHAGGPLCEGVLSGFVRSEMPGEYDYVRKGEILRCPWHQWEFDVKTGQPGASSPDVEALANAGLEPGPYTAETYDVSLEEQYIVLEM
jgi:3-phenylpropionate/trans-cinnamate dioxygenase ferredoxin subunit